MHFLIDNTNHAARGVIGWFNGRLDAQFPPAEGSFCIEYIARADPNERRVRDAVTGAMVPASLRTLGFYWTDNGKDLLVYGEGAELFAGDDAPSELLGVPFIRRRIAAPSQWPLFELREDRPPPAGDKRKPDYRLVVAGAPYSCGLTLPPTLGPIGPMLKDIADSWERRQEYTRPAS